MSAGLSVNFLLRGTQEIGKTEFPGSRWQAFIVVIENSMLCGGPLSGTQSLLEGTG